MSGLLPSAPPTAPVVNAAPLPAGGTTDQDRIVNAGKRVEPSVVALRAEFFSR